MSRIGKMPIALPAKVTVSVDKGNLVTVSGPKGTLKQQFDPDMTIDVEGNEVKVLRPTDQREHRAQHGLTTRCSPIWCRVLIKAFDAALKFAGSAIVWRSVAAT